MGYSALCCGVITFSNRFLPLANFQSPGVAPNCTLNLCSSFFHRVFTFIHCSFIMKTITGFMICGIVLSRIYIPIHVEGETRFQHKIVV